MNPVKLISFAATAAMVGVSTFAGAAQAGVVVDDVIFSSGVGVGSVGPGNASMDTSFGSVDQSTLESGLGLPVGFLGTLPIQNAPWNIVEGSGVTSVAFAVNAGDSLDFVWEFLTNEANAVPIDFNDFAFAYIQSEFGEVIAEAYPQPSSDKSGSFNHIFTAAGNYVLALGVVDVGDSGFDSTFTVGKATVTRHVPEPGTVLGLVAIGGTVLAMKKRKAA